MLNNTGIISFVLYGIFILITIIAMIVAFRAIKNNTIASDKLDKMIELFKYSVVSVAIATVTLIVSNLFKEREEDVKELEYFDKYAEDVKKVDGIQERFLLSKYLSIVAPSGALKTSWKEYFDSTKVEYNDYLKLKAVKQSLDLIKNPTLQEVNKKQQIAEKIEQKESPLVTYKKTDVDDFSSAKLWESKGFDYLFDKNLSAAINAFIQSENFANQYHQVYEISQYLRSNKTKLMNSNSEYWKVAYSKIAADFSGGMLQEIKDKFLTLAK